jgi:Zn-dependent protease
MQSLLPEQFSVQAIQALEHAGAAASRSRALSLSSSHLLLGVLAQQDGDAAGVLAALGHDPETMVRSLKEQWGGRQMVHWNTHDEKAQDHIDPHLRQVLAGALSEAQAAGLTFASTRDLLVSILIHPTPEITEWQQQWAIDPTVVRQAPVSVYEVSAAVAAEQRQQAAAQAKARRQSRRVSPIFLGLVAALAASGAYLYWAADPPPFAIFVFVTIGWIVSLALHEFGHAIMAYAGGDYSVEERGYLTLNPLKYTHPVLSIVMPVIFLILGGIGLPGGAVYVNLGAIRSRWMQSVVSAAGPAANGLVAILLALPFLLITDWNLFAEHPYFWSAISLLIFLQVTTILFNLLPVPGLDGFGILAPWLPMSVHQALAPLYSFGFMILLFLFWYVDVFNEFFWNVVWIFLLELNIPPELVGFGFSLYRFWA